MTESSKGARHSRFFRQGRHGNLVIFRKCVQLERNTDGEIGMSTTTSLIEESLERWRRDGDEASFQQLATHTFRRLQAQCKRVIDSKLSTSHPLYSLTGATLASEVYHKRLRIALEAKRDELTTAVDFFKYVSRHIQWELKDMLKKLKGEQAKKKPIAEDGDVPIVFDPALAREQEDIGIAILDAVHELQGDDRDVYDLHFVNALSETEVAAQLGKTRNQVNSIWRRVQSQLGSSLQAFVDPAEYENLRRCKFCGKTFRRESERDQHQSISHDHACEVPTCRKTFISVDELEIHLRQKHFKCDFCDTFCGSTTTLKQHEEDIHFKCPHKDCEFDDLHASADALRQHKADVHFICIRCNTPFESKEKLGKHRSDRPNCTNS